jgi:hypothetical protein
MIIFGIHGKKRAGKDTIGRMITQFYGVESCYHGQFALSLRQVIEKASNGPNGPSGLLTVESSLTEEGKSKVLQGNPFGNTRKEVENSLSFFVQGEMLEKVVDRIMREDFHGKTVGWLLQFFGTEVGREILGENIWVDRAGKDCSESRRSYGYFTDTRFKNEFSYIRENKGYLIKVIRRDAENFKDGRSNNHSSETALDDVPDEMWDCIIDNNGTEDELRNKVYKFLSVLH